MTPGLAYSFSWFLNDADIAQVRDIIESLRQHAIDLGSKSVSEMEVQSDAHQVYFIATIPGSTEGKYGLASTETFSWSSNGTVVISSAKTVGEFHHRAASLGIQIIEIYAGMIFESKKNADGIVETEQRPAFDLTDF